MGNWIHAIVSFEPTGVEICRQQVIGWLNHNPTSTEPQKAPEENTEGIFFIG